MRKSIKEIGSDVEQEKNKKTLTKTYLTLEAPFLILIPFFILASIVSTMLNGIVNSNQQAIINLLLFIGISFWVYNLIIEKGGSKKNALYTIVITIVYSIVIALMIYLYGALLVE